MKDFATLKHHPMIEEIVDVLCNKTQNTDRSFFRVMTAFFVSKIASSMRAKIITKDRGEVPVNVYALSLATSGSGKGYSVGILEDEFISGFRERFMADTFPMMAEVNMRQLAQQRATRLTNEDPNEEEEYSKLRSEFIRLGALAFTFDSGTGPAVKQLRQKLLLANAGAINLQIDEIGSNLVGATEVLNVFLELYDQGRVKQKLTKNTNENQRSEELDGKTPTNCLLFGTPAKLLDGSKTEDEFYSMLETGYARRCIFAYGHRVRAGESLTPAEIYHRLTDTSNQATIDRWATHFTLLADPTKFGWEMQVDDAVGIELIEYRTMCEKIADALPDHEEIKKAEVSHRYFKVLKLAGALAFCDESPEVTMDHLYYAIKLVEESGQSFERIFTREKPYVKLAKYLAAFDGELTHADLTEALPFYKGGQSARNEMINLATAWAYKNHIIIKKSFEQGIEFFRGETLKETSLESMIVSYSDHIAYRYRSETVPFDQLHKLVTAPDYHFINHGLIKGGEGLGHRTEENCLAGFNMVVLDVDKGFHLDAARELLKDHTHLIYTTKSHQIDKDGVIADRFRILLPINYHLEMDADEFREFMANVFSWLPFEADTQTGQRARKWATNDNAQVFYNTGELLDALKFIPKTSRNEEYRNSVVKLENLDNLERWFAQRMVTGSRNNQMLKFAMLLVDTGQMSYQEVERRVMEFNAKLDNKLPDDELRQTVLVTAARKMASTQSHP